ncbi:MAG: hypothetical protein ACTSUE_18495 [Promethearchaeota archaeon]
MGFHYGERSDSNWRFYKNFDENNPFELIDLEIKEETTKLTVDFDDNQGLKDENPPGVVDGDGDLFPGREKLFRFYADIFFSKERLKCIIFYSIKNISTRVLSNFKLYNLYDFDIEGLNSYNTDYAYFDANLKAIVQYNKKGVHVGIGTSREGDDLHFTAGIPHELEINEEHPDLDDQILPGPEDLFIGMELDIGNIEPGQTEIVPMIVASGESRVEFESNLQMGVEKARRLMAEEIPLRLKDKARNERSGELAKKMREVFKNNYCSTR